MEGGGGVVEFLIDVGVVDDGVDVGVGVVVTSVTTIPPLLILPHLPTLSILPIITFNIILLLSCDEIADSFTKNGDIL